MKLRRLHEAGSREAGAEDVGRQRARLQGGHSAVQGRHLRAEPVEGGREHVPPVGLALGPAVHVELQSGAVAEDRQQAHGRPGHEAADAPWRELVLDQIVDRTALREGIDREVASIEGRRILASMAD